MTGYRKIINGEYYGVASLGQPVIAGFDPGKYGVNVTCVPLDEDKLTVESIEQIRLEPGANVTIKLHISFKPLLNITCNVEYRIFLNSSLIYKALSTPLHYYIEPGETILNITADPLVPGYLKRGIIEKYGVIDISIVLEKGLEHCSLLPR